MRTTASDMLMACGSLFGSLIGGAFSIAAIVSLREIPPGTMVRPMGISLRMGRECYLRLLLGFRSVFCRFGPENCGNGRMGVFRNPGDYRGSSCQSGWQLRL